MSEEKKRPENMTIGELEAAADNGDQDAIEALRRLTDRPEVRAAMDAIIEQTRQLREELQTATAAFSEQMQAHYSEHKAAYDALKDRKSITAFARTLTKEDLDEALIEQEAAAAWKQLQTAKRLEADEAPKKDVDKAYFDVLSYLAMGDAIALYEHKTQQPKTYRTRARAKEDRLIAEMPTGFAIPTMPGYEYSVSLFQNEKAKAHLMTPLSPSVELRFSKGKMYIDNGGLHELSEVELENLITKESITSINLPILRIFYNIILAEFQRSGFRVLKDIHTVYVPDVLNYMGEDNRINKENIARLKSIIESYHNMVGVCYTTTRDGKKRKSRYPVLNFEGDSEEHNTVDFSSPYLNHIIRTIFKNAVRKTKDGAAKVKKSGDPLLLPNHSYLIDPSIVTERNKAAVENVFIIIAGIEQAGGKGYHIAASTLIERNPQLAERLEKDPAHRGQLLKRVFTKTWELLRTKTKLAEVYKNIELPDPKDPAFIPTVKGLSSMVFEIKHDGKIKAK